jgi:hypothetical protein
MMRSNTQLECGRELEDLEKGGPTILQFKQFETKFKSFNPSNSNLANKKIKLSEFYFERLLIFWYDT